MVRSIDRLALSLSARQVALGCVIRGAQKFVGSFERATISPSEWTLTHTGHPRIPGEAWSFSDHLFQIDMMDCAEKHVVIMKSRKLGISEIMMRLALYWIINNPRTTALYTFPTGDDVSRFHDTRLRPTLSNSPFLASFVGDLDNKGSKKIGESFLTMRGTWSERQGQAIESDFMIVDELDFMPRPDLISDFRQSMSHSLYGYERDISTPRFPDLGIDSLYKSGSMTKWMVRCSKCDQWQYLTLDHIHECDGIYEYRCEKCKSFKTLDRSQGKWDTGNLKAPIKSYHVNQLAAPWISASEVVLSKKTEPYNRLEEKFHNQVLGLPHKGHSDAFLPTRKDMMRCRKKEAHWVRSYNSNGMASMGVDWGKTSWCQVSIPDSIGGRRVIWVDWVDGGAKRDHADFMISIAKRFNVGLCIADEGDGADSNPVMLRGLGGRFLTCYYWGFAGREGKTVGISGKEIRPKEHRVIADKTHIIKSHLSTIRCGQLVLPYDDGGGRIKAICDHHNNIHAREDGAEEKRSKSEFDVPVIKYGNSGPDHLVHCGTYDLMAFDILRGIELSRDKEGDEGEIGVFGIGVDEDGEGEVETNLYNVNDEGFENEDDGVVILGRRAETRVIDKRSPKKKTSGRRIRESHGMRAKRAMNERNAKLRDLIRSGV